MFEVELRNPWYLTAGLLSLWAWRSARRPTSIVDYSSLTLVQALPLTLRQRLTWVVPACLAGSVIAFSLALARPRTPLGEAFGVREGIAMSLVVDRSSSMDARDLVPGDYQTNRLDVAQTVMRSFLFGNQAVRGGRSNDLVAVVTFAAYADGICPLTFDHHSLMALMAETEIADSSEDGTAIGDALGLAVARFRDTTVTSKVIILLTDGENNAGLLSPQEAAELAAEQGIKIYCIGVGSRGQALMPFVDDFGRTRLTAVPVRIDEATLQQIATITSGQYFRATDEDSLREIYQEIDQLERSEVGAWQYLRYEEHFRIWVWWGIGLLGVGLLARAFFFETWT